MLSGDSAQQVRDADVAEKGASTYPCRTPFLRHRNLLCLHNWLVQQKCVCGTGTEMSGSGFTIQKFLTPAPAPGSSSTVLVSSFLMWGSVFDKRCSVQCFLNCVRGFQGICDDCAKGREDVTMTRIRRDYLGEGCQKKWWRSTKT